MNTWRRRLATVILFIVVGLLLGWRFTTLKPPTDAPPRMDEIIPIENAPDPDRNEL